MHHSSVLTEFRHYILLGGLAFFVDFSTLFMLTDYVHLHYLVSASIAFLLGLITIYYCSIRFVFNYRTISDSRKEFIIFAAIGIAGLILNNMCLFLLTSKFELHYLLSKLITAGLVLGFNFSVRRRLLFTPK